MESSEPLLFYNGHIAIALLWVMYFAFHSLLASRSFKAFIFRRLPWMERYYRLFYNITAIVTILPVLLIGAVLSGQRLFPENNGIRYLAMFFATWGVIVIRLAFKEYSFRSFIGLDRGDRKEEKLKKSGILSKIRHPLYAGGLLIVIGYALFAPTITNLIICLISVIYIFIGMRIEERRLTDMFGQEYISYKDQVPALIPWLKF